MDIEKLIERLRSHRGALFEMLYKQDMDDAATALSVLQAENEKLRDEAEGMRSNWYKSVEEIQKLRAELEQVKREKESLLKYAADMGECCLCTYDSFCPTDNPMFGDCEECEKSRKCPCITCSETKNWQWRGAEKG